MFSSRVLLLTGNFMRVFNSVLELDVVIDGMLFVKPAGSGSTDAVWECFYLAFKVNCLF